MSAAGADTSKDLTSQWIKAFRQLLTSMTSQEYSVEIGGLHDHATEEAKSWKWWSQEFNILAGPAIWIGADNDAWLALGGSIGAALGIEDADPSDAQSIAKDLVAQSTSALVQELAKRFKTDISCQDPSVAAEPPGAVVSVLVSGATGTTDIALRVGFNDALVDVLQRLTPTDLEAGSGAALPPCTVSNSATELPKTLTDLKLRVQARLGRTTLPLRAIFKLSAGSVVDLNRSVTDLVDIVINGRIIASGRVVVCNGNYAVEISTTGLK